MSVNTILAGTTTVTATADNQVWVMAASVVRNVAVGSGFDSGGFSNITLSVAGTLSGVAGIYFTTAASADSNILIADTGHVSGTAIGIRIDSANTMLVNDGTISGDSGVYLSGLTTGSTVLNNGTITSNFSGVLLAGVGNTLINYGTIESSASYGAAFNANTEGASMINAGGIHGQLFGVLFSTTGYANTLINSGTISTVGSVAVKGDEFVQKITNTGTIEGEVLLEGGNDFYDTSNGASNGLIDGGAGNDVILTGAGSQEILGGDGNDLINSGSGADMVTGGSGNDILNGRAGKDNLLGNSGADILNGGGGNDTLKGGGGQDLLRGGIGNDKLFGGGGADVFKFAADDGTDRIKDYVDGTDLIDLSAVGIASFAALSAAIAANGSNAVIDLALVGGTGEIIVVGAAGLLSQTDFIL